MKKITYKEYEAKMSQIIHKNKDKPVHESLIAMLNESAKYELVDKAVNTYKT